MIATNQQMTREQLDELMVVAASMQRDAEKLCERPVAIFAYAVQLVLMELCQVRQQITAAGIQVIEGEGQHGGNCE